MMNRVVLLTGALAIALSGAAVMAASDGDDARQGHKRMHGPRINFEEVDTNKDGKLTQDEITAHKTAHFKAADTDGNGALSAAEMKAQMEKRAGDRADKMTERMIGKRDKNGDGELSMDEMQRKNEGKMFARMDTDKDGAISAEEFAAMQGKHRGEHKSE